MWVVNIGNFFVYVWKGSENILCQKHLGWNIIFFGRLSTYIRTFAFNIHSYPFVTYINKNICYILLCYPECYGWKLQEHKKFISHHSSEHEHKPVFNVLTIPFPKYIPTLFLYILVFVSRRIFMHLESYINLNNFTILSTLQTRHPKTSHRSFCNWTTRTYVCIYTTSTKPLEFY